MAETQHHTKGESWIRTYTGLRFDPFHPDPASIKIEDIAHALSLQCRFSGHTRYHYSVAQHCIGVADQLPADLKLKGLLHDASEAYVVDIPSPIKHQMALSQYRELEEVVMKCISKAFGLGKESWWHDPAIKLADMRMGATEARDLMINWEEFPSREAWLKSGGPLESHIMQWTPRGSEVMYLADFRKYSATKPALVLGEPRG